MRLSRLPYSVVVIAAAFAGLMPARAPAGDIAADSPLRRAPRVSAVVAEHLPQAELLGTPEVRTLLGYTRRVLHLPDGHTLALFSFSNSAPANWLFLIDSRDLSVERHAIPNNDIASHGAALGSDGNIYIMPYGNGRAYRFDVATRKFSRIETGLPNTEYTWDAFGARNGCIYFGTYPNSYLGEYDIASGRCTLWERITPNTKYVTTFSEDDAGRIRFKAWGPDQVWMSFDPPARRLERAERPRPKSTGQPVRTQPRSQPAPPDGDERFGRRITVGRREFAIGFPSSRLWEIKPDGDLSLCGDPQSPTEVWFLEHVSGALIGISHFGVAFRYDLNTRAFIRRQLSNRAPGGNGIMFIETVTPRCVIGANYSQQNLFKIDPQTGRIDHAETMVARVTGEPMCAVGFGGKAYVGIYVSSLISLYDPARPFAFGKNPRELIELGARYQQTRPRAAVTDGRLVYVSSDSAYNHLGGALAVIDPETERIDVYHHLIRDQNLPTLAYDPGTKLLWGGTDRWGQMHSHPPTQETSLIYALDPGTRRVVARLVPWKGADVTSVKGTSADGILVGASGSEIALIDTATREILYRGELPIPMPHRIRRSGDGACYCVAGGTLYRWDLTDNVLTRVAQAPGCRFLTEPSPGTWLLADSRSIYRLRLAPPSASRLSE